jgi:hypothetical protein
MSQEFTEEQIAIRQAYQEWLLGDVEREVAADLARIRRCRNSTSIWFLERTKGWAQYEILATLRARIKARRPIRQWKWSVADLTAEELRAYNRLDWQNYINDWALVLMRTQKLAGAFRLDRRVLRSAILGAFQPLVPLRWDDYRCVSHVGDFTVLTDIGFGGGHQVSVSQWLARGTTTHQVPYMSEAIVLRNHGLMAILGDGALSFDYLTPDAIPDAADLLVQTSQEFIAAVPGILARAKSLG